MMELIENDILYRRWNAPSPKAVLLLVHGLGAAYLAGLGVGFWKDTAEIERLWAVDRVFAPAMRRPTAAALYKGRLAAVEKTLSR